MRTLVEMRDDQIAALDRLAKKAGKPRAFIISTAIEEYVTKNAANGDTSWFDEAVALWAKKGFNEDGLV